MHCVNAADLMPLAKYVENQAGRSAAARLFAEEGVPTDILGQYDVHLPYADVCGIYERAARFLADSIFGARCGATWGADQLGPFGDYILAAPTLKGAIERAIQGLCLYESGSSGVLRSTGNLVEFHYVTGFGHPIGWSHYVSAKLGVILNIVRSYTGPDWQPLRMTVDNIKDNSITLLEDFHKAPIGLGHSSISVAFDASDLNVGNPREPSTATTMTLRDLEALMGGEPPVTFEAALCEVVRMRLLGGLADIDGAARHLRLSIRTLQRRLARSGISYRQIVNRERTLRARVLLEDTDLPVTEIAMLLGYAYLGCFTRAFKECLGHAPRDVRRAV